jgi:hypothetical protein
MGRLIMELNEYKRKTCVNKDCQKDCAGCKEYEHPVYGYISDGEIVIKMLKEFRTKQAREGKEE